MIDSVYELEKKFYKFLSDDEVMQNFLDDEAFAGIWFWDLNHPNTIWLSKSLKKLLGFDANYKFKLPGSWDNLVPPNEIETICSSFDKYLESNTAESFEIDIPFIQKNKHAVSLHCRAITVKDKSYLLGLVQVQEKQRDLRSDKITAFPFVGKKNDTDQVYHTDQENASKYESVIIAGNLGGWEYEVNTNDLWCSKEYFDLLGYDTKDIRGWGKYDVKQVWIDLLHPDDLENATKYFGQYLKNLKGVYYQNFRMKHADGRWLWISSRGKVMVEVVNGIESTLVIGTHTDISESKRLEEELQERKKIVMQDNALLKSIIDSPQDILIVSIDTEYRYTAYSPKYQKFVKEKFNKEIFIGFKILDIFSEAQLKVFKPAIDSALSGKNVQLTISIPTTSGQLTYVENRYNAIVDSSGKVIGATVFIHDITKEKEAENSNKINELRYASLFTSAMDAIFIANIKTGIVVDVNLKACELMEYERSELIGIHQTQLHPAECLEGASQKFQEFTESGDFNKRETYVQSKSGKKKPVLISVGAPFKIGDEQFTAGFFKDLTKLKKVEATAYNLLEMLKVEEMISTTGSIEVDLITKKITWSDEFFKILGYEPQSFELDMDSLYNHIFSEDKDAFVVWQERAMQTKGQSEPIDLRILKNDGTISSIRTSGISFENENGIVTKFIAVAKDITNRKRNSEELFKQNKQLKEIAWTQSHIVRAPLTRLMGLVYAIQKGIVPETEKEVYYKYIVDSAHELDSVIKDITAKTVLN
ncbi:MAG: PAS domain S-box protein [Bacteroidetes bacterium]|nr:PAS domain S-box protein [Bacteroidota bacterium]